MPSSVKLALAGVLYGLILTAIGFSLTAAGHGTNLLLRVASAPLSLLGFVAAFVGAPILWGVVGAMLPSTGKKPQRQMLVGIMFLHYVGVLLVPFMGEEGEWKYLERMWGTHPVVVLLGLGLYLAGQTAILIWCFQSTRRRDSTTED